MPCVIGADRLKRERSQTKAVRAQKEVLGLVWRVNAGLVRVSLGTSAETGEDEG